MTNSKYNYIKCGIRYIFKYEILSYFENKTKYTQDID